MLFAQTGLNSEPLPNDQPSVSAFEFWWLIPIAFGSIALVWYLRGKMNRPEEKSASKPASRPKATETKATETKAKSVSLTDSSGNADASIGREAFQSNKSGKKKKKDRSQSEKSGKTVASKKTVPVQTESKGSSDLSPSPVASNLVPVASSLTPQVVVPSSAIFEPLRDVRPPRRKAIFSAENDAMQPKSDAVTPNRLTGGKFERTAPAATVARSVANRWPTSAAEQIKTAAIAPARPQILPPSNPISQPAPAAVSPPAPVSPLTPAKGLTSFVSKVRSPLPTDSVSTPEEVVDPTNAG